MDYQARADELFQAFESLCALVEPSSGQVRFPRAVAWATAAMLSLPYNLARPDRPIKLQQFNHPEDDEHFDFLLAVIYRFFLIWTHLWCEQAIIEFCSQRGIPMRCSLTRRWENTVKRFEHKLDPDEMKELAKMSPRDHPSNADYVSAATQHLPKKRKTYWRIFFKALTIVRNKLSHGLTDVEPELTADEMKIITKAGLSGLLGGNRLQLSALMMPRIIEHLIWFFRELDAPSAAGSDQQVSSTRT